MNVIVTFKVPADIPARLSNKLVAAKLLHARERTALERKTPTAGVAKALEELDVRGGKLTATNMMRLALELGAAEIEKLASADVLAKINEGGIKLGRPSGR